MTISARDQLIGTGQAGFSTLEWMNVWRKKKSLLAWGSKGWFSSDGLSLLNELSVPTQQQQIQMWNYYILYIYAWNIQNMLILFTPNHISSRSQGIFNLWNHFSDAMSLINAPSSQFWFEFSKSKKTIPDDQLDDRCTFGNRKSCIWSQTCFCSLITNPVS